MIVVAFIGAWCPRSTSIAMLVMAVIFLVFSPSPIRLHQERARGGIRSHSTGGPARS